MDWFSHDRKVKNAVKGRDQPTDGRVWGVDRVQGGGRVGLYLWVLAQLGLLSPHFGITDLA